MGGCFGIGYIVKQARIQPFVKVSIVRKINRIENTGDNDKEYPDRKCKPLAGPGTKGIKCGYQSGKEQNETDHSHYTSVKT